MTPRQRSRLREAVEALDQERPLAARDLVYLVLTDSRPGRPSRTPEEKAKTNRERVARWRAKQKAKMQGQA